MIRLLKPVVYLAHSRLGQLGIALATASGLTLCTLFTTSYFGVHLGPYAGIVGFLILPAILVCGLLLIAAGTIRRGPVPATFTKQTAMFVGVMTAANLALLLTGTYRGIHDMDQPGFCGQACHVMTPQFTAWSRSQHSRVACVACHVAPGTAGLIDAKLAGTRQLLLYLTDRYSRPIHGAARETCRDCHNPPAPSAEMIVTRTHFASDERNTPEPTTLILKTGAIHKAHGGTACADCHNRVGHNFPSAAAAVDAALRDGQLDARIPFARKRVLEALTSGASLAEPALSKTLSEIRRANLFPDMKVSWGTYPANIGHDESPGCFTCHDGGKAKNDCDTCHRLVEVKPL